MQPEKLGPGEGFVARTVSWAGAYLISFVGVLHLLLSGEHIGYEPYLGVLFLVNAAAATVSAVGLARTGALWAWLLGVVVAGGAFIALLWSRIVGLPGYPDGVGQWFNFAALTAVAFELPFLAVAGLALSRWGKTLVSLEQRRIDVEDLPPDKQETPEHFRLIEGQMREIRDRMAPDVQDLRLHLDPKARKDKAQRQIRTRAERAQQDIRERLRSLLRR